MTKRASALKKIIKEKPQASKLSAITTEKMMNMLWTRKASLLSLLATITFVASTFSSLGASAALATQSCAAKQIHQNINPDPIPWPWAGAVECQLLTKQISGLWKIIFNKTSALQRPIGQYYRISVVGNFHESFFSKEAPKKLTLYVEVLDEKLRLISHGLIAAESSQMEFEFLVSFRADPFSQQKVTIRSYSKQQICSATGTHCSCESSKQIMITSISLTHSCLQEPSNYILEKMVTSEITQK